MPCRRATAGMTAAAFALACDVSEPDTRLYLEGTVTDRETAAAVGGAVVSVWSVPLFSGSRERLGEAVADDEGHYTLRADQPDGYAVGNCSVMDVTVSASGYETLELPLDWMIETRCSSGGRHAAHFGLEPSP